MKKPSLEDDIKGCVIITDKVKSSDDYAQNLYAALCNNTFQKQDLISVMRNESWSCSWRYAGSIIADIRDSGNYIDWYCSGMYDRGNTMFVSESTVTEEVATDIKRLGWVVEETY